jgi:hypothetical protein
VVGKCVVNLPVRTLNTPVLTAEAASGLWWHPHSVTVLVCLYLQQTSPKLSGQPGAVSYNAEALTADLCVEPGDIP